MKFKMKFKNKEDKLNYILDIIEMNEDVSVICNYEIAKEIYNEFIDERYEYVGIDLQSDVGKFLISLKKGEIKNVIFCIEPLERNSKNNYPIHETKLLLIDKDIWNKEDNEFLNHCDYENIEMLEIEQKEKISKCECKNKCKQNKNEENKNEENKNYICNLFEEKEDKDEKKYLEDYLEKYVLEKLKKSSTYEEQLEVLKDYGKIKQEDGEQEVTNDIIKLFMDKGIDF